MEEKIKRDKHLALATLKDGLEEECADSLTEIMINLEDGTCDYIELISVLEQIAHKDWFYYFDDNGAGGFPHADMNRKTSFRSWALKAIQNINDNARFGSSSMVHNILKSNNTLLIKTTLEQLKNERKTADESLLPILEKIARKDVYKKYSYLSGFETDCQLGALARDVINIIKHSAPVSQDKPDETPTADAGICLVCRSLPDDITVNTGRDEYFPSAFRQLISMDNTYRSEFRCCKACGTYFNWIDMSQMYGSGNNDEERLVRLSPEKSRVLNKLFSADSNYRPDSGEVEEYIATLSLEHLVSALGYNLHRVPEFIAAFVPHLVRLLEKNNDTSLWSFLQGYVTNDPKRAEEVMNAFQFINKHVPGHVKQLSDHCLTVLKK